MLVMMSRSGEATLVLGIVEDDVKQIQNELTLTYFGRQMMHCQNIMILYGRDKAHLIKQLRDAGVEVSESWEKTYMAGERTDREGRH